ncbi:MAG: hypothetical protein DSM107014_05620 [Gomphosphaeria aponina SAG 52.96 = DSM 107014]|uniref:Uncharacterized protein n=1 Tax=Gomphosphaeria aponina SAG 52.96 = DSM 107014 TaxID=1521640 RepID=A0A941GUL6_9CHRO|nr:hypothetical protein [Gomphosphaeria aponina SAG 52.96 = DSM 107014]
MNQFLRSYGSIFRWLFLFLLPVTLVVYVLRGFGVLAGIPGGIILCLVISTLITGIIYGIDQTKRF